MWNRLGIKVMVFCMVVSMSFLVPTRFVFAGYWGEEWAVEFYDLAQKKILYYMEGVLLSKLKSTAMRMLDQQIEKMIGGAGGNSPMFITDFREYIGGVSLDYTHDVMNDFFTNSLQGKFSVANYVEVGGVPGFSSGNSMQLASVIGQQMKGVVNADAPIFNYDQNSSAPGLPGTVRDLNAFIENPMNNPIGAQMEAEQRFNQTYSDSVEIQKLKALSSGYLPNEKNGQVLTPAGTVEAVVNKGKTIGFDGIANATNWQELATGLVSSYTNQIITRAIETGIGAVQSKVAQKFGTTGLVIANTIGSDVAQSGLGAQFSRGTQEKNAIQYQSLSNPANSNSVNSGVYFNDWSFSSQQKDGPINSTPGNSGTQWSSFITNKLSN